MVVPQEIAAIFTLAQRIVATNLLIVVHINRLVGDVCQLQPRTVVTAAHKLAHPLVRGELVLERGFARPAILKVVEHVVTKHVQGFAVGVHALRAIPQILMKTMILCLNLILSIQRLQDHITI